MQKALPLIVVSLLLLSGCNGISSTSEASETTALPVLKFPTYNFLDDTPEQRKLKEGWIRENPDMRDFYAGTVVTANGTWNSRTPLGYPKHSVEITCVRRSGIEPYAHDDTFYSEGLCIEAKATFDEERNFIGVNTNFYDISKWDFDEIVAVGAEDVTECYRQELKLDRKNEAVTMLRTTIPGGSCLYEPETEPLLLHLGCAPMPWPTKNNTLESEEHGTFTQYCFPDFENMTQEQKDIYAEQSF